MKILLLTQVVPYPPDAGPKIKTYNVLRALAQQHKVHLLSFVRSPAEEQQAQSLQALCSGVTTVSIQRSRARDVAALAHSLVSGKPFLIDRDDSRAMRAAITEVLAREQFDAVHADQLSMAQFAVDLPLALRVLDEHNAVWSIVQRAAAREDWGLRRVAADLEWRKLRAYERAICQRFDRVTVVSEEDRRALSDGSGRTLAADVIPIAIDTQELQYTPRLPRSRNIVSVATMFYPPNVESIHWFATEVFPSVRPAVPGVTFAAIGARPPRHIQHLAVPGSGIEVPGYVADLEPVLRASALLVVPLHSGSGMRVKILEAFARGIPVVSTTVGVEGIDARAGQHLLVADAPRDFAAAVIWLLHHPEEAARLARAGRALVEARYDWRTALAPLNRIYGSPSAGRIGPTTSAARELPTADPPVRA